MDYSSIQADWARTHSLTNELRWASFDLRLEAALKEPNLVEELHQQLTFEYHPDISRVAAQIMAVRKVWELIDAELKETESALGKK